MTGSPPEQHLQLRLFLALGVITLTLATALATVGDAAANGPQSTPPPSSATATAIAGEGSAPQQQQVAVVSRIIVPGIVAGFSHGSQGSAAGGEPVDVPAPPGFTPPVTETPSPTPEATNTATATATTAPATATPVPPTAAPPPPTAVPTVEPGAGNCPIIIYQALGLAGCKISYCESGWNPNAVGTSGELGWFQVSPRWHPDATIDPAGNVAAAVRISANGTNWSAWSVRAVLQTGHCPNGVAYPG